ncbi:MAG: accessory gene regulator B family protein [Coprobacillaceae bacterium]
MNKWLLSKLLEYGIANDDDLYKYGLNALSLMVPAAICLLIIGWIFSEFVFSFIFLILFAYIRGYYPGGHLKSKLACFVGTIGFFILLLACKESILENIHVHTNAYILIILILGTIMQTTKLLTNNIDDTPIKKSILVITITEICFFIAWIFNIQVLQEAILLALTCNFVLFTTETLRKWIVNKTSIKSANVTQN